MREIPEGIEVPNDPEYQAIAEVQDALDETKGFTAKPLTGRRLQRAQDRTRQTFLPSSRTIADGAGNTRVVPVTWQRQHMHLTLAERRVPRFTVTLEDVLAVQRREDEMRRHRIDRKRPRLLAAAARATGSK